MLDEVLIDGGSLTAALDAQVVSARLTLSRTQVTNLVLTVVDTRDLRLTSRLSDVFTDTTNLTWGDWKLKPRKITTGGDAKTPTVTITCTSRTVHTLDKQTGGKTWGPTGVSGWARDVIASADATPYVQPNLGEREIEREEPQGDNTDPETTFDVLAEMAKQTGAWLYEDGRRIVLGKPSWLAAQPNTRRFTVEWNTWTDHTPALTAAPEYEVDFDAKPYDGRETLTLSLVDPTDGSSVARQARPGDLIHYTGNGAPTDPLWIITSVALPQHWTQPTTITAWRPVDPPEIVPDTGTTGTGNGTAGVPTGPIGAAGWAGDQLTNAAEIVKEGQRRGLDTLAMQLAVTCAMGESSLRNIGYGDVAGPDSTGLFQQRDTWGSRSDRMTPSKAAGFFYDALKATPYKTTYANGGASIVFGGNYGPGNSGNSASLAIHNVQRNSNPTHYAQWWNDAKLVVKACLDAGSDSGGTGPKKVTDLMKKYQGQYIDVDGFPAGQPYQCVDLVKKLCMDLGLPQPMGNGMDYYRNPTMSPKFRWLPASARPVKGDVCSWSGTSGAYQNGGVGHTAIFDHMEGGTWFFLSQNPGPARVMPLSTSGLLGLGRYTG